MSVAKCQGCRDGAGFDQPFSMAFQPIVDLQARSVFAYEALVRGPEAQGAFSVLSAVDETNRYAFDQACRVKAIELSSALGLAQDGACVSINFLPNAVYQPRACIRATLAAAARFAFPLDRIVFEFTETEQVDAEHLGRIISAYKDIGFRTAVDDFGAGYSGLTLLSRFQPDLIKLDMELIRDIDRNPVKRTIVASLLSMCEDLCIAVVAEGVESAAEMATLADMGVSLFQGYALARPAFEALPPVAWPDASAAAAAA